MESHVLQREMIGRYRCFLIEAEKSTNTIRKYLGDIDHFYQQLGPDKQVTKLRVLEWKTALNLRFAASSVNSMLVALNGFFAFLGWEDCRVRLVRCQRQLFRDEKKELTREEYGRLVCAARACRKERLALILETLCATGIRVSELQFITVEALSLGKAAIVCKGKRREILIPRSLRMLLRGYAGRNRISAGPVFRTKTGNAIDRSNIWHEMKALCRAAAVSAEKVFPHNLRHLFARTFYKLKKDIAALADILGHASINTTRIYMAASGAEQMRQVEKLNLII